ncbi:MAG: hypothetical protein ABFD97_16060 [Syntrophobacter sp.]
MPRILFYISLMVLGYFLIKKLLKSLSLFGSDSPPERKPAAPPSQADMIRDPQCGRYFMKEQGIKGVVDGKVIHFCSEQCYDQYRERKIRE